MEPEAEIDATDMAEAGRTKGFGDRLPASAITPPIVSDEAEKAPERELGCCRTANTNVLLIASREHCGCAT